MNHGLAILLVAATTVMAGCRPEIQGDGAIKAEDRPITEFSHVAITGGYQVTWTSGKPALKISTDQNLLPHIKTVIDGNTLAIGSNENLAPTKNIEIILSSKLLADIQLTGGITFMAGGIAGSNLKVEATGASDITVAGFVTNLDVNLTGASTLKAKSLQAQTATLSLVGASDASVDVTSTLKASVTGAGSLTYSGNPTTVDKSVMGAGSIEHRP